VYSVIAPPGLMPIGLVNSERPERAEAFAAGCRKAKLKGACTALVEVLKNDSQRKYVSPNEMVRYNGLMGDLDHTFEWRKRPMRRGRGAWNT
jgi:hypothetical protein